MRKLIRHGDVLLCQLKEFPQGAKLLPMGKLIIPGEDGHQHVLEGVRIFETGGQPIVFVPDGMKGSINHEEHGKAQIPAGIWEVRTPRRYDPRTRGTQQSLD